MIGSAKQRWDKMFTKEDGIEKMTYPSGTGALYNLYSFSSTKFTSGTGPTPTLYPLILHVVEVKPKKKIYQ